MEDCPISRLSNLPKGFESIPYMAFNCTLDDEELKIDYEVNFFIKDKILNYQTLRTVFVSAFWVFGLFLT